MANRTFNTRRSIEKEVVDVYLTATIGATGAPTLVTAKSKGVSSITRSATGTYDVVLEDAYQALLWADGILLDAAAEDLDVQIETDLDANGTGVTFFTRAAASATDPSDGSTLKLKFELRNSSVG